MGPVVNEAVDLAPAQGVGGGQVLQEPFAHRPGKIGVKQGRQPGVAATGLQLR